MSLPPRLIELLDLLTAGKMAAEERARVLQGLDQSPEASKRKQSDTDTFALRLSLELGSFSASGDKIDEIFEKVQVLMGGQLPQPPAELQTALQYFEWLDPIVAAWDQDGGYDLVNLDDRSSENLHLFVVRRRDVPRILKLAAPLKLRIARALEERRAVGTEPNQALIQAWSAVEKTRETIAKSPDLAPRLFCFDCDLTLSGIDGINELARSRGKKIAAEVEAMTHAAMEGSVSIESIFARRLELIRPSRQEVTELGQSYIQAAEPNARAIVAELIKRGLTPIIVSEGLRPAIRRFADYLGIEQIEAVDIFFDRDGSYAGFDRAFPTTRGGGKAEVLKRLRAEMHPQEIVMMGDGVPDLETDGVADCFFGFHRYVMRERLLLGATASFNELGGMLQFVL